MDRRRNQSPANAISGGIFLLALALAFALTSVVGGWVFLPILFLGIGFSTLLKGIMSGNQRAAYGAFHCFFWMIILALFFITHSWIWFLVGAGLSAILGALFTPIMGALLGLGSNRFMNPQQQPVYYQPVQQPYPPEQPPYEPGQYQEGYQQPQQASPQQEGKRIYTSGQGQPQQERPYEQPIADYPQELPPQQ